MLIETWECLSVVGGKTKQAGGLQASRIHDQSSYRHGLNTVHPQSRMVTMLGASIEASTPPQKLAMKNPQHEFKAEKREERKQEEK